MRSILLGLLLACVSTTALAAPFCVATSYGENCWYYSADQCQRAAAQARGACIVNREEMGQRASPTSPVLPPQPRTGAPFCVVASFGQQCFYYDYPSCQRAAASANGACVYQQPN